MSARKMGTSGRGRGMQDWKRSSGNLLARLAIYRELRQYLERKKPGPGRLALAPLVANQHTERSARKPQLAFDCSGVEMKSNEPTYHLQIVINSASTPLPDSNSGRIAPCVGAGVVLAAWVGDVPGSAGDVLRAQCAQDCCSVSACRA